MSNSTEAGENSIKLNGDNVENIGIENSSDIPSSHQSAIQSQQLLSKPDISIAVSLLIESVVKNMCTTFETDPEVAKKMFKFICDQLYDKHLIGESYKMNEFEGIRSQIQKAIFHIMTSPWSSDQSLALNSFWPKTELNSHYLQDFAEISYIAEGGGGQVYKVKHKLDGTEYAIKKIPIKCEGTSVKNYLSEVKRFASMNHSNIVQYKGAWLEPGPSHSEPNDCEDSTDFQIDFKLSISDTNFDKSNASKSSNSKNLSEEDNERNFQEAEKIGPINKPKIKWATLYIQMSLCQSTLKQWLESRNSVVNPDRVVRNDNINCILAQLLSGLEYIHSKNIVHHDIKPSNIFVQNENGKIVIQLGDFGLACLLQSVGHGPLGTEPYAAPEQLEGKCDQKSDMYSLGIVLFELVENFGTDMELSGQITTLKNGYIPPLLLETHPQIADMIKRLVVRNPDDRPNSTDLLRALKSTESEQVEQLRRQVAKKDEENLHLKEIIKKHGIKNLDDGKF